MIKTLLVACVLAFSPSLALADAWTKMPITEVPATAPGRDDFVVFYSGDQGWSAVPREVSAALAQAGVPVVGVDALRYYWRRRQPDDAAADLDGLIAHYAAAWGRPHVILVGYSFGADALPVLLARLPAETRAKIDALVLISPADRAHLAFRFASWFDIPLPGGYPLAPALAQDAPTPVFCIQAMIDARAACRSFPTPTVQVTVLPGGHHYIGERQRVAGLILDAAGRTPPSEPQTGTRP